VIFTEFRNITPYFAGPLTLSTRNQEICSENVYRTQPSWQWASLRPGARENQGKDGLSEKGAVMFSRAQQNQHHSAAQRPIGRNYRKVGKARSVLEPLSGVALSVFIAGILVPSFLRSGMAAHYGLAVGSLSTLTIGGVKLSYTLENLSFAILGAMFGSLIALAIEFPATFAKTTRTFLMFRQVDWKCFLSRRSGRPSRIGNRKWA
jgi:hypothetical protein